MSLRHLAFAFAGLLVAASPVGADSPVFRATAARLHVSLDGKWRFAAADEPQFARPELDDRSWAWIPVPGNWKDQGYDHTGFAWYRLTFAPPPGSHPRYLRFDGILDRAEVWLNGVKLTNPSLSEGLADYQLGAFWGPEKGLPCGYLHLWSFRWPLAFDVTQAIRPGKNVLAVRVCNDPTTSYWIFARTPDPTNRGAAGILESVYLICAHEPVSIAQIVHEHPKAVSPGGLAAHRFDVSVDNRGGAEVRAELSVAIRHAATGEIIWREQRDINVPAGESHHPFAWDATPQFESYEAEAILTGDKGKTLDQLATTFVGTVVEPRGSQLYVNGEPFLVKGANAFPGHYWQDGAGVVDWGLAERDCALMQSLGVNSIRGFQYPPQVIELAARYGITVNFGVFGPSCSSVDQMTADGFPPGDAAWVADAEIMALAARDYPNVIMWNTANEVSYTAAQRAAFAGFLEARRAAVHRLDPVGRPCAYSNLGNQDMTAGQDVIGWNLYGVEPEDYARYVAIAAPRPAILTEWGLFTNERDYAGTLAYLAATWRDGILRFGWTGAYYYSGLEDYAGRHPGFRSGPGQVHAGFCAGIKELYRDLDAVTSGDGIELRNRRAYTLRGVIVRIAGADRTLPLGDIAPGGTVRAVVASGAEPPREIDVAYTTHGGLACRYSVPVE